MACTEYRDFTKEPTHHRLSNGFALLSAPERAFGIHYALNRNANAEFEDFLEYGSDLEGLNYCFWVLKDAERIGGIILRPNHVEGLFVGPPHTNAHELLQAVLPLLRHWSDPSKPIEAVDVLPHELQLYERLGFQYRHARRVYIRPTECFDIHWDEALTTKRPEPDDAEAVASLLHASFRDYPANLRLGGNDLNDWRELARRRYVSPERPELLRRASTLVHDEATGQAVGLCCVGALRSNTRPENAYAIISILAVAPQYRRRGIAANMLRHALTTLHGHHPTLKFGVAAGNAAEAFYYSLGFLAGPTQYTLALLAENRPNLVSGER